VVPVLALGAFAVISGSRLSFGRRTVAATIAIAAAVPLAWLALAATRASSDWLYRIVVEEGIARYRTATAHEKVFVLHWLEGLALLLPWTPWFLAAVAEGIRVERSSRAYGSSVSERLPFLLPLCWIGATLAFFLFSRGKRAIYFVPTLPPAALLVAWFLGRDRAALGPVAAWLDRAGAWLLAIAAGLTGLAAALGGMVAPRIDPDLAEVGWPALELLICAVALGGAALAARRGRGLVLALSAAVFLSFWLVHARLVPAVDAAFKDPAPMTGRFLATMAGEVGGRGEWAEIGHPIEGILWASDKPLETFELDREGIAALGSWLSAGEARYVVLAQTNVARVHSAIALGLAPVSRGRIGHRDYLLMRPERR
jgi:4-amino-4-deoxy-L-arabinose transferase-like glycosyltransferase